jgi:hypothetical protein
VSHFASLWPALAIAAGAFVASGCSIVGPSCLSRQKTGPAATASGRVEPGQVVSHLLRYDLQGSQNDVTISWSGQGQLDGPRLRIYATAAACADFVPPAPNEARTGACAPISRGGGYLGPWARECARSGACAPLPEEIVNTSLIVTGPGNGARADFREYTLHVVGDPVRASSYSVTATWFYGPDC